MFRHIAQFVSFYITTQFINALQNKTHFTSLYIMAASNRHK